MDKSRKIFERRRSTLTKKAGELTALCNVEVCVVCFGPNGDLELWPENPTKAESIMAKYREASKRGNKRRRKEKLDLSDLMESEIKKLKKQFHEEEYVWGDSKSGIEGLSFWNEALESLSYDSLTGLADCLERKIRSVSQVIDSPKGQQIVPSISENQFEHKYVP